MQTNILLGMTIILCAMSCKSYRIVTRIDVNGGCIREIYIAVDSNIAGKIGIAQNPFPFIWDSSWNVVPAIPSSKDQAIRKELETGSKVYIKAYKRYPSVTEMSSHFRLDNSSWKEIEPKESLEEKFRWFYTYYYFTGVYPEVKQKGAIPLDNYMTKEEQQLWFKGDYAMYKGMNGIEMSEILKTIEKKFEKWCGRSMYEISFSAIVNLMDEPEKERYPVETARNFIFHSREESFISAGLEEHFTDRIIQLLDAYFHSTYFSALYKEKEKEIEERIQKELEGIDKLFDMRVRYELVMPGRLISADTELIYGDTLAWNVDTYRFFDAPYTLSATSRKANLWAFILSGLFVAGALIYIFKR